jgi:hypothetical protein
MWITIQSGSFAPSRSRSVREFRDPSGVQWCVFRATPHTFSSSREKFLPEPFRLGWLVFECERERRRLAPVPEDWEGLTERELERLRTLADVVPTRGGRRPVTDTPALPNVPIAAAWPAPADRTSASASAPQVQALLAQVIREVCDEQRDVRSLDTGQLVRVEETLAIAARAAREAAALRMAARDPRAE